MPVSRPTNDPPEWATADVIDGVTGVNNVIEPPDEKKAAGWNLFEHPARQWLNWFQRAAGQWLVYLADRDTLAPMNSLNFTSGGADIFPAAPDNGDVLTGYIFATNINDNAEFCYGYAFTNAGDWHVAPIAQATLSFGAITGRSIAITGIANEDLILNVTVSKVGTVNLP